MTAGDNREMKSFNVKDQIALRLNLSLIQWPKTIFTGMEFVLATSF